MSEANQSVMTGSVIVLGDAGVLRRYSAGRSRVRGRNPLRLIVLRAGLSQDLSRDAGIEGDSNLYPRHSLLRSQDLSRDAGIEGSVAIIRLA